MATNNACNYKPTQYTVQVGGASGTLANVGPGSSGQVLQSGGASANPAYSTATYPSTAGTSGNVLTSDGTNWTSQTPATTGSSAGTTYFFDDFLNYWLLATSQNVISPYFTALTSGTSASFGTDASFAQTNPGVHILTTGTTSTGYCLYYCGQATTFGGGSFDITFYIRLFQTSTSSQRFILYAGYSSIVTGAEPTSGAYFLYSDNVNSGNWQAKTANASTRSTANSSTAVAANTWYKLRITVNAAANSASFYVNGSEIANSPLTTNIPTVNVVYPFFCITKTVGATSVGVYIDYCTQTINLTSSR